MDAVTILDNVGLRKAAILVASLDQGAADALLDRLDLEQADALRQAAALLAEDEIDGEERERVAEEFRRIGPMLPDDGLGGIELDGLPAHRLGATEESAVPFEFLSDAEDQRLAGLLRGERPPTVALVLSHLPPERAGRVLACFAPAVQVEIVRRMADIENTDPETVREVQRALESRWSRQTAAGDGPAVGGPDAVARILAACDPQKRGAILANLAAHDQPLAEQFGHREVTFADLARSDDAALVTVLRRAEPEVVQAALLGAPSAIVEQFLASMPKEQAKRLRFKLDHPDPIRLSDVEEAQRQIAVLARQLAPDTLDKTAA
jgi:flagellar motor switch protein FliG